MKVLEVNGETLKVRLSPSFINNAACPLYLKYNYVDKIGDKYFRVGAERGKVMHEVIAELVTECHEAEELVADITDERLVDCLETHMTHVSFTETSDMVVWLKLWRDRFVLSPYVFGIEEKISLDDEFDETAWDNGSYRGIVDLIETEKSTAIITDWKSQPNILSQHDLDTNDQLTHYAWLTWKNYPHITEFRVRIWYLRYGFFNESTRTEQQLEDYEKLLMLKESRICAIDNWDPIPGKHCGYCDFIHLCPLAQDRSKENNQVITQEQAADAASRITVMESLTKQLKGKLKDYVKANDAIMVGDWIYGFKPTSSTKFDPIVIRGILAELNLGTEEEDLVNTLSVDGRKFKKFLKTLRRSHSEAAEAIEASGIVKHATRFSGYKRGDQDSEDQEEEEG